MNLGRLKIALRGCKNVYVRIHLGGGKYMWAKGVKRQILQCLPDEITQDERLLAEQDEENNLYIGFEGK
jgi:hypothetical protein